LTTSPYRLHDSGAPASPSPIGVFRALDDYNIFCADAHCDCFEMAGWCNACAFREARTATCYTIATHVRFDPFVLKWSQRAKRGAGTLKSLFEGNQAGRSQQKPAGHLACDKHEHARGNKSRRRDAFLIGSGEIQCIRCRSGKWRTVTTAMVVMHCMRCLCSVARARACRHCSPDWCGLPDACNKTGYGCSHCVSVARRVLSCE
jgi:hypothetical protein